MKVAIIGGSHAGVTAAKEIKTHHPDISVTLFERNSYLAFISASIAPWMEEIISSDENNLFLALADELTKLGVEVKLNVTVTETDLENKEISYVNREEVLFTEKFDKIILATGSRNIEPNGKDDRILQPKSWHDARHIVDQVKDSDTVAVIGAGYVGIEIVESLIRLKKTVYLIDRHKNILNSHFSSLISKRAESILQEHGVIMKTNQTIEEVEGNSNTLHIEMNDERLDVDTIIAGVGFVPNSSLFEEQLEVTENGAVITDGYLETSIDDVFAIGDLTATYFSPLNTLDYAPLATNAIRQGMVMGYNITSKVLKYPGNLETSVVNLFDYSLARTGFTSNNSQLIKNVSNIRSVSLEVHKRANFMSENTDIIGQLWWSPETQIVLGAEFMSNTDITEMANTMAIAIQNKLTLQDLLLSDFFFQPQYSQPLNFIALLARKAIDG